MVSNQVSLLKRIAANCRLPSEEVLAGQIAEYVHTSYVNNDIGAINNLYDALAQMNTKRDPSLSIQDAKTLADLSLLASAGLAEINHKEYHGKIVEFCEKSITK